MNLLELKKMMYEAGLHQRGLEPYFVFDMPMQWLDKLAVEPPYNFDVGRDETGKPVTLFGVNLRFNQHATTVQILPADPEYDPRQDGPLEQVKRLQVGEAISFFLLFLAISAKPKPLKYLAFELDSKYNHIIAFDDKKTEHYHKGDNFALLERIQESRFYKRVK
jgi:hypothetical protein